MQDFIKHKLAKLGCFVLIAIGMILVSAVTKIMLGWLNFDNFTQARFSEIAGEYFGKSILGLILLVGLLVLAIQLRKELRGKQIQQSPSSSIGTSDNLTPNFPPHLPVEMTATISSKKVKMRGCMIAIAILLMIPILALATIWYLASEYEKQPKKPGQAATRQAEDFIRAHNGSEASGNTPEAMEMASDFARNLRITRGLLITDGSANFADGTQGRFLTYCFLFYRSIEDRQWRCLGA